MIRKLVSLCIATLIMVSCSNDMTDFYSQENANKGNIEEGYVVSYDDMFVPYTVTARSNTRSSNDVIIDDELIVAHGADRTESKKKAKLSLNSTAAAKFDLPQGIYVVEYLLCYKTAYKPGYDIWYEDSENCGYKPSQDFELGNSSISMTKERGYKMPESNGKELMTFVIHVISDLSGRKLDKYDPCAPNDIEWVYSISQQF